MELALSGELLSETTPYLLPLAVAALNATSPPVRNARVRRPNVVFRVARECPLLAHSGNLSVKRMVPSA